MHSLLRGPGAVTQRETAHHYGQSVLLFNTPLRQPNTLTEASVDQLCFVCVSVCVCVCEDAFAMISVIICCPTDRH